MHGFSTHAPFWHASKAEHVVPHAPQFAGSVESTPSQPFPWFLSQSSKPGKHCPIEHCPAAHVDAAFAKVQGAPHAPQFIVSTAVSDSQPVTGFLSQSVNPVLHEPTAHAPLSHTAVAFARLQAPHSVPQPNAGSFASTHVPSQLFCPVGQLGPLPPSPGAN